MDDIDFMLEAIKEADKGISSHHGGPFGAIIVKDGKIVGRGHNQVILRHDATCHGEMMAIRDASEKLATHDLSGCEIYTTGYPCPMCMGAILWANIDKIHYGCNVEDTEKIGFRDKAFYEKLSGDTSSFIKEVGRKECLELYERYISDQENEHY